MACAWREAGLNCSVCSNSTGVSRERNILRPCPDGSRSRGRCSDRLGVGAARQRRGHGCVIWWWCIWQSLWRVGFSEFFEPNDRSLGYGLLHHEFGADLLGKSSRWPHKECHGGRASSAIAAGNRRETCECAGRSPRDSEVKKFLARLNCLYIILHCCKRADVVKLVDTPS